MIVFVLISILFYLAIFFVLSLTIVQLFNLKLKIFESILLALIILFILIILTLPLHFIL